MKTAINETGSLVDGLLPPGVPTPETAGFAAEQHDLLFEMRDVLGPFSAGNIDLSSRVIVTDTEVGLIISSRHTRGKARVILDVGADIEGRAIVPRVDGPAAVFTSLRDWVQAVLAANWQDLRAHHQRSRV